MPTQDAAAADSTVEVQDDAPDDKPDDPKNKDADETAAKPIDWLKDFSWRSIGPTATGGRVVDIEVDPNNDHHIFVASAAGGLWETINNGTTWKCIFRNEGSISIGDIAIDPKDINTIWIGSGEANNQRSSIAGDGIYKTTDGGKTWKNMGLSDSHHIGRVVVDPTDSNTVYVAALGHLYSANEERGLFKTTDGGATWTKSLFVSPMVGVVDVVVNPNDSKIILAATYERLRKAWDFDGNGPGSAIYRSTDGGTNWNRIEDDLPGGDIGRIGLAIYAKDPNVVYATVANQNKRTRPVASTSGPQQESDAGQEPSEGQDEQPIDDDSIEQDSEDGENNEIQTEGKQTDDQDPAQSLKTGQGFSLVLKDGALIVEKLDQRSEASRAGIRNDDALLSVAGKSNWDIDPLAAFLKRMQPGDRIQWIFQRGDEQPSALLAKANSSVPGEIGGEIYRSDDAGVTWKKTNQQSVGGNPAYYYGQIVIDPQNDQQIYVLSVPVYVSKDGGKTFAPNGATSTHVDHHAIWVNPKNSNHVMLGNDGGFHISYDRCKTWDYIFNIPLAQFYAISADNQQPYHIYGGLQDNGSWGGPSEGARSVPREAWYRVGGGDGFYVQIDPNDHNLIYSESQFGAIGRQNRATGERASIRPPQSEADKADGVADRYNWNSPILLSQHESRTIYFGGNKLFMSYNQGDEWLTISPDLTTNDPKKVTGNVPHCTITTIAESPLDKNFLMVGTDDGKVHITRDRGQNWSDISTGFPLQPSRWWCSRVEFSHAAKETAFVSFTGYREDDFRAFVFMTIDGGKTWQSIASNLPQECVNVIKQDPRNPMTLYLGTDLAAYVSMDEGKVWHKLEGLPTTSVQDLLIHPRERVLIIGTHGQGIYVMDDVTPFQENTELPEDQPGRLFSIRDWVITGSDSIGSSFAGDRKAPAANSQPGAVIWYQINASADTSKMSLVIQDLDGKEVAKLSTKKEAGWHRVIFPESRGGGFGGRRGGGRAGGRTGPSGPGTYTAVLTIGDKSYSQRFQISN